MCERNHGYRDQLHFELAISNSSDTAVLIRRPRLVNGNLRLVLRRRSWDGRWRTIRKVGHGMYNIIEIPRNPKTVTVPPRQSLISRFPLHAPGEIWPDRQRGAEFHAWSYEYPAGWTSKLEPYLLPGLYELQVIHSSAPYVAPTGEGKLLLPKGREDELKSLWAGQLKSNIVTFRIGR